MVSLDLVIGVSVLLLMVKPFQKPGFISHLLQHQGWKIQENKLTSYVADLLAPTSLYSLLV